MFLRIQIMHLHGACLFIYVDSFLKHHKEIAKASLGLYGASYELCISLLATHFVYRFLAICRPNYLNKLSGYNLLKIYILPIVFSVIWFLINYFSLGPSDLKAEYMRKSVFEHYNEDTRELGYLAVLYFASLDYCGRGHIRSYSIPTNRVPPLLIGKILHPVLCFSGSCSYPLLLFYFVAIKPKNAKGWIVDEWKDEGVEQSAIQCIDTPGMTAESDSRPVQYFRLSSQCSFCLHQLVF
ncbi:CRE-STR-121 protein [Caenorhabditis remanei]|uniref:CRE-STR-121 protein n=1 Tax=Caenorhabditis remanei TaxID=31234 RepID=E3MBN1_CAERE|nr:CRE-STR-121 protein [Caenorhabditis remanei]